MRIYTYFSAYKMLGQSPVHIEDLARCIPEIKHLLETPTLAKRVEIEAEYFRYMQTQSNHMDEIRKEAMLHIPDSLDLSSLPGLSNECRDVLMQARPGNVSC